ncbi:response regulator [Bacteriovorax sp. DB6_IX]|uniref:response regulator n=1 Tax=Bacteriovorax sp. DB6_IX TaxID=1353530 RepID=UPI000389EF1C|nr:response regulator [Bacteriovorax sp. DB6_IX]EQC51643.1 response regulator receiver domain protein [Bacteriovorax sp. DB6_IX]
MEPILIVDDQHDILSFIEWELKSTGVECSQADNISDAINLLKERKLSCIFLDILLDDKSSEDILRFLKSEENSLNADIPIVVMSAFIDENFISRNAGKVYKIVEKPFEPGEISSIVTNLNQAA